MTEFIKGDSSWFTHDRFGMFIHFGLFMKMDVLGGELEEPVWVGLPYIVSPK